jgi:hypothetical protein
MPSSTVNDIAAFEEQHHYGCLTDLEFAAAVASLLRDQTNQPVGHPAWLTTLTSEIAELEAEWKRAQWDRYAMPVRGGRILPSRWLAAACCAWPIIGIPLFALFCWPALAALSNRFREAPWPGWAALLALVLIPTAIFPAFVYWWAIQLERADAEFKTRRAAIILETLHRRADETN